MEKITTQDGQSADLIDENIEQMKQLFPEAFSENGVDFDVFRQLLGDASVLGEGEEKYGLNWHGKKKARQIALTPSMGTLLPRPDESVDWNTTQNLFIEGDNLEVLKLLQKSYVNKVKMIYIDPPYNTGKEFVYPDNYQDNLDTYLKYTGQKGGEGLKLTSNTETGGRKHTNWLNMMYPRLKIAKNLLAKSGVIFVSIDDNEQANVRKICDEIFGAENFIAVLPTIMNLKGNHDAFGFSDTHEYTVVYAKSKEDAVLGQFDLHDEELDDWEEDEYGIFKRADTLRRTGQDASRDKRPNGWFPVFITEDNRVYITDDDTPTNERDYKLWPLNEAGEEMSWTWSKNTIANESHNLIVVHGRSGKNIYKKQRPQLGDLPTKKPKSIFYKPEYSTSTATTQLKKLMGRKVFDGPKPVPFIEDLVKIGAPDDGIILDFFAGSGTTAHAVMKLSADDKKKRRGISVQLPEAADEKSDAYKAGYRTIAAISKDRLRKALESIKEEKPDYRGDLGFKAFTLAGSNIRAWNPDRTNLEETLLSHQEHLLEGRTEQDLLYELLLKRGVDLAVPIETREVVGKTIYSIGAGVLFACLDLSLSPDEIEPVAEGILAWQKELDPEADTHVFFRDSAFSNDNVAKTNMVAILEQNGITHIRSL